MQKVWFFIVISGLSYSSHISFVEFCLKEDLLKKFHEYDKTSVISQATSGRIKEVEIFELLPNGEKTLHEEISSQLKENLKKECGPVYGKDY